MANLIAVLVQKTTALVEATTKAVGSYLQLSKTVASGIDVTTKTTGEYMNVVLFQDGRSPSDIVNVSTSGIVFSQNYGEVYFFEDYVGTSRTIT
jgi:hypothetical protein